MLIDLALGIDSFAKIGGPPPFPEQGLTDVALRGSTANGTLSASYVDAGTMAIPAGAWAIGIAYNIPSGQSFNAALFSLGDQSDTLSSANGSMTLNGNFTSGTVQPYLGAVTASGRDDAGNWLQPLTARQASTYYWSGSGNATRLLRGPKIGPAAPYGSGRPTLVVIQKTEDGFVEYWIVEEGKRAWLHERQPATGFGAIAAKPLMIGRYNRATAGNAPNTANVSIQRFFRMAHALTRRQIEKIASGVDPRAFGMSAASGDRLIAFTGTDASQTDLVSGQAVSLVGGTFAASPIKPIPAAIATDAVRVNLTGYGQVRNSNGAPGTLRLDGTAMADGPIYARLVDFADNNVVVRDWQQIATAAGGVWEGDMTAVPRNLQWYSVQVRLGASGTVYTAQGRFGVGKIYSLLGQSWHERFRITTTATAQAPAAGFVSRFIRTQDQPYNLGWEVNSIMGYGELKMAEQMAIAFGAPAAADVSAVNGSSIAGWLSPSTAFDQSLDGILLNHIEDLFWQQGQGSTADGYSLYKSRMHQLHANYKAAIPWAFRFHVSPLSPCATTTVGWGACNEIQRAQRDFIAEVRAAGDTSVYYCADIQDCAMEATGLHALDDATGTGRIVERYVHHLMWLDGLVANSALGPEIISIEGTANPAVFHAKVQHNGGTALQCPQAQAVQGFEASLTSNMASPLTITDAQIIDATTIAITLSATPASLPFFTYQGGFPGRSKTLNAGGWMDNIGGNYNPAYDNRTPLINQTLGFPVRQMLTAMEAAAYVAPDSPNHLTLENGDAFLLEDGSRILLENA